MMTAITSLPQRKTPELYAFCSTASDTLVTWSNHEEGAITSQVNPRVHIGIFRNAHINQYVFCGGNPVNFTDAFGLCTDDDGYWSKAWNHWIDGWKNYFHDLPEMTWENFLSVRPEMSFGEVGLLGQRTVLGEYVDRFLYGDPDSQMLGGVPLPISPSGMNSFVRRGQAPEGVKRVDRGHVPNQESHIHYSDGTSSTQSGGVHDAHKGTPKPNAAIRAWLQKHGWIPPPKQ